MSKKILLFCAIASQFPELISVAKFLKRVGNCNVLFVFGTSIEDNKNCLDSCEQEEIPYICIANLAMHDEVSEEKQCSFFMVILNVIKMLLIESLKMPRKVFFLLGFSCRMLRKVLYLVFCVLGRGSNLFFIMVIPGIVKILLILPLRILTRGLYLGFFVLGKSHGLLKHIMPESIIFVIKKGIFLLKKILPEPTRHFLRKVRYLSHRLVIFETVKYVGKRLLLEPVKFILIKVKYLSYRPVLIETVKRFVKRLLLEPVNFIQRKAKYPSLAFNKRIFSVLYINHKRFIIQRMTNNRWLIYYHHILSAGKYVGNNVKLCELIINVHRPDLIMVPIETVGYFFDPVAPFARRKGIPVITIPFCYVSKVSTANWFINHPAFKNDYGTYTLINKLIAKLFPNWVFVHKGEKVLRSNFAWILFYRFYRISKKYPWIDNHGFANVVLVESQYFANLHTEQGVPADKIKVMGSLQHDIIYNISIKKDIYKRQLCDQVGLECINSIKLVVLSFPDEFIFSNRPCEFDSHDDIRKAMLKPLFENENVRVVISLHPRLSYENVKHLESPKAKIGRKPIAELLPCADLFITVTSAAIRLAISCGLPVIDYDVFRYNDKYYNSAGGVITVQNYDDYAGTVNKLLDDETFCVSLQEKQKEASLTWGRPDGCAGKRLLNIMNELIGDGA